MLSDHLKEATKTAHQQLEKKLIGNIKAIRTTQDYAGLLSLFYSFFGGMEKGIEQHIDARFLPDYPQRRKAVALAEDIQALNINLPLTADISDTPSISNHLQAMGALYVMEGSTLGGKIISKIIRQQLGLPEGFAMTFFDGYGADTDAMWQTFKAAVDQPLPPQEEAIVVQAANETFIRFRQWFEKHLS